MTKQKSQVEKKSVTQKTPTVLQIQKVINQLKESQFLHAQRMEVALRVYETNMVVGSVADYVMLLKQQRINIGLNDKISVEHQGRVEAGLIILPAKVKS